MVKFNAYYWIPQVDHTINGKQHYRSQVLDATLDKKGNIIIKTDFYFPVGSIFHYICGDVDYVIKSQDKDTYETVYAVRRCDGQESTLDDVFMLKTKKWIYRDGFEYEVR